MNERIRELMEQAVTSIDGHTFGKTYVPDAFTEKFAELIVKECALTLESITVTVSESYEEFDNEYNKALLTGSEVIKKRFGVE